MVPETFWGVLGKVGLPGQPANYRAQAAGKQA
jgi:hypothetical protein